MSIVNEFYREILTRGYHLACIGMIVLKLNFQLKKTSLSTCFYLHGGIPSENSLGLLVKSNPVFCLFEQINFGC